MVRAVAGRDGMRLVGLHVHVGSQITTLAPLAGAARTLAGLAAELAREGIRLEHLDLGGGLGIPYAPGQSVPSAPEYADVIVAAVRASGLMLLLEPGRWLVGPSGVLLTTVVDLKERPGGGWFVIVDAGMTDLIRPAFYDAWHTIEPVGVPRAGTIQADVVGPVCETSDVLARNRELPCVEVGDLLAVRDTGAYGAVMASNYNRRPMAAEVMVEAGACRLIRRRQTADDMMQWDL
jgi:diaminopimelate decarboxylase